MSPIPLFEHKTFCIFGMSRSDKGKFGNTIHEHLTQHGYTLYPIHPEADELHGATAYREIAALPGPVDGAIICLPPARALEAVRACADAGVGELFLQQGSESDEVLALCRERGLHVYYKSCAIMCSRPTGFHSLHAFFAKIFGGRARELRPGISARRSS